MTKQAPPRLAIDIGIVVADMDRALAFYRDLLELPVVGEVETSLIGPGRMVQLRYGHALIKLVKPAQQSAQASPRGITGALGFRYLTLIVEDARATMQRVIAAGIQPTIALTQLQNGAWIGMVEDPDGNTIEFVQEADA